MLPKISIVTPSYNQGRFIEETIKSVISQEGDFYIDYIIVDGGSGDNSAEIIKKYDLLLREAKWPVRCRGIAYRWVSEKDRGQADAINKGFRLADGDILAWLNSDDTYLEGTLRKVAEFFASHPEADVLYGKSQYVDENGKVIGHYPTRSFDRRLLATFNFICQPSAFFRRTALDQAGPLDISLHFVMDYDLWIRMSAKSVFLYLSEIFSTYRLHGVSKTMSPADAVANHEECLRTVLKYYDWAPLNRVYGYCYHLIKDKIPSFLGNIRAAIVPPALFFSIVKYFQFNRKLKVDDVKMIRFRNISKLFRDWINISRDSR